MQTQYYIEAGQGFNVDANFARVQVDTPVELAPAEYAKPGYVIGYIAGNATSNYSFMRPARVRIHVPRRAVCEVTR